MKSKNKNIKNKIKNITLINKKPILIKVILNIKTNNLAN